MLAALLACLIPLPAAASAAAPVRIMALGDSITGSPGCWRALLWQHLRDTGRTNVDFVGTLPAPGCGFAYDGENEGHGGFLATRIAQQNQLPGWLSATRPDVVLMHLGTNDVWSNISTTAILSAYTTLLNQMRASNPGMRVLLAQIIPMNPSGCPECGQRVVELNNAIPGWARANSTARSPITVVDQWTGFSTTADTTDGVHPNGTTGIRKIESRWYPALTAALDGLAGTASALVGTQSGRCLEAAAASTANGARAQLWDCGGGAHQRWSTTNARELRVFGSKCLDVEGRGTTAGTAVQIWDCNGQHNQQWTLNPDGSVTGVQSGLCLDAAGQGTANGTRTQLWPCNGQANQKWTRR
ncbi:ricin-type beta-trefoil lectin domain protein [Crossiella sp. SN42]|uniref:SGNH/GDSL hydrolase family protein n=1 Tax=Crossiella sp. SN42 TaxID=2944808 RepID=UPI00207C5435|nr:SGNH/GDSL hydrolase family protein [Crossiella sp. SN42]MCO1574537.1 ricin-type beta-trefoil lectin domain protein [Crossiella sp. SN42]